VYCYWVSKIELTLLRNCKLSFMKKILLILFSFCIAVQVAQAQYTKYIIKLKHKGDNPYSISNPSAYLTPRALARRTRYSIAIDSSDLPITPRFIDSIRLAGAVTILNSSKWLNQIAIQTTDAAALTKINNFPFVLSTGPLAPFAGTNNQPVHKKLDAPISTTTLPPAANFGQGVTDVYSYGSSNGQVKIHNGQFLHNRGYSGQGMQMAVMDAGFYHYLSLPTFDSVRNAGQILGTWDFVAGNASVDEDNAHGMQCLSTIAANMPGVFMGQAPKTSFYLYRTEDVASEYPIEEQNWAAAAERADSLGVDVFSVSLGYYDFDGGTLFDYTYANMDGNTTISARAADMAAKKGILAVFANGNEGNSAWHFLISPADADSVLAVGAVNTSGAVASFSSYGPSSDGQIKPSVAAVGWVATIANPNTGGPAGGNGTSFACPNMAGITTCLWQAFPEENNMSIINALQQSASRATNPDDRVGYGIPNMLKAFSYLIKQRYTQNIAINSCKTNLQFSAKTDTGIVVYIERKLPTDITYSTISTHTTTGAFAQRSFNYVDDISALPSGSIKYRIRMKISTDTTFYLDSATVNFIAKPALGADKNASICGGNSFDLTTQFNTVGLTTTWNFGVIRVNNPTAVTEVGTYQLIATNPSGCSDTALVILAANLKPNLGADKSDVVCGSNTYNLTTQYNTTGLTTNWTIGGTTVANPASVNTTGTYRLIATNTFGCTDTAFINLLASAKPNLGNDVIDTFCSNGTYDLTALYNTTNLTTTWSIGGVIITNPTQIVATGIYKLIVVNANGCSDTAQVTLSHYAQPCKTQITPNPVSDKLFVTVYKNTAAAIQIIIYNTAGQRVYYTEAQQTIGAKTYTIPMAKLSAGIYYVQVNVDGKKDVMKKVLKR
jgi:serine protease AprX